MAKKLREAKTGVYVSHKLPQSLTAVPADLMFFIDSEVQLEILRNELTRTARRKRTPLRTVTSETQVADPRPQEEQQHLALI